MNPIHNRVVIILSGGLDSTTLLYKLLSEKKEIFAITFDYGQKHSKEINYAKNNCNKFSIPQKIIQLSELNKAGIFGKNSLTSNENIPEGHYQDKNMQSTVVANRNMIMISIALAYSISIQAECVYYGAHSGDHEIYPDCRPEFVKAMQNVSKLCHYWPISLKAPFLYYSKGEIVKKGSHLNVDYSKTWTCYKGGEYACGKCASCIERLEAFELNNIKDPLTYEKLSLGD